MYFDSVLDIDASPPQTLAATQSNNAFLGNHLAEELALLEHFLVNEGLAVFVNTSLGK